MKSFYSAILFAAVLMIASAFTSMAASYSANWYEDSAGWHIKDAKGNKITNAWLCDDVQDASKSTWYLIDGNGNMVSNPLVQDGTGNFYSLETEHSGFYGSLRHKNGTYDGVALTFNQEHGGSFGAITGGLDSLKAKYPVTSVAGINNGNCVYTSTLGSSATAGTTAVADNGSHPSGQEIVNYLMQYFSSTSAYLNGIGASSYFLIDSSRPAWNNGVTNVKWIGVRQPVVNLAPNYTAEGVGGWIWWEYNNGDYCPIAINEEHYILADTTTPDGLTTNKYGICAVNGKPVTHCSGCMLVCQSHRFRDANPGPNYAAVNSYADGGYSEVSDAFVNSGVDYKGMFIDYGTLSVNHWEAYKNNEKTHGGFGYCSYKQLQ